MPSLGGYDADEENFGSWRRTITKLNAFARSSGEARQQATDEESNASDEGFDDWDFVEVSPSTAAESHSEPESEHDKDDRLKFGLRYWNHGLYKWFQARIDTKTKAAMILGLMAAQAGLFYIQEDLYEEELSVMSIIVVVNAISLVVSIFTSFFMEGAAAVNKICDWHALWRFLGIAFMFVVANQCEGLAFKHGLSSIYRNTLGYLYLPLSALMSYYIFDRDYGQLEWLSLVMLVLAIVTFILIRERCKMGDCVSLIRGSTGFSDINIVLILASVVVSVIGSLFAERIYKERSKGLMEVRGGVRNDHFYIMKVHLDLAGTLISGLMWVLPTAYLKNFTDVGRNVLWFGTWSGTTWAFVFVSVVQWWMAGLITKRFSTVVKALASSVSTALVIFVKDPWLGHYHFERRWIPSACMVCIIVLSALIFQTGRINLRTIRRSLGQVKSPRIVDLSLGHQMRMLAGKMSDTRDWLHAKAGGNIQLQVKEMDFQPVPTTEDEGSTSASKLDVFVNFVSSYTVIVAYVFADAARTEIQTVAIGKSMMTPQSMAIMGNLTSFVLFNFMVFMNPRPGSSGVKDLREVYRWRKILKFLVSGMFFAVTSALMSMGMGLGISGSLSVVIGKIYLPFAALASRWVLGKFYLWLEWFAIIILTLDSMAFGFLQSMSAVGRPTSPLAILCVAGAAIASAMNSLVSETLMKSETDPFVMQKVRLDFGSVLFSFLFLPVMGWISDPKGFPQGAFWRYRPLTKECSWTGFCAEEIFMYQNQTTHAITPDGTAFCAQHASFCSCECGKGVFVCWDDFAVYLMLAISVAHSIVVGMLVKKFSSVYRAVADNFSLMIVYFIGDPLINGTNLNDRSLNLAALILPLSSQIFSCASAELKAVEEAQEILSQSSPATCEEADDQSQDGESQYSSFSPAS